MIAGVIRNAAPVSYELVDKARRMAWKAHAKHRGRLEFWDVRKDEIGSGHFSKVYKLTDGLVLKVGGPGGYGFDGRGMYYEDDYYGKPVSDAWPKYVEWTASMRRRPSWAPKVHHLERLVGRVYFAIMEELTPHNTLHRERHRTATPCKIIKSVANSLGLRDDMHSGNFMLRTSQGCMTTVITDPWCTRTGAEWD